MTFDSLTISGTSNTGILPPYVESGFSLTNDYPGPNLQNTFVSPQTGNQSSWLGSASLVINSFDTSAILTRVGGSAFDLTSIDLALAYNFTVGRSATVTFTGTKAGGGTVTQNVTVSQFAFQTFTLTGFTGLLSAKFGPQVLPGFQFDNIVLDGPIQYVPEPASLVLLASGLLAVAGSRVTKSWTVRPLRRNQESEEPFRATGRRVVTGLPMRRSSQTDSSF